MRQRQRLWAAEVLAHERDLAVVDEPTVGPDPRQRVRVRGCQSADKWHFRPLWTAPPLSDGEWDAVAESDFTADSTQLALWSITAAMGEHVLELPALGDYRVRAHVRGQADIRAAGPVSFVEGVERWLVQLWPV